MFYAETFFNVGNLTRTLPDFSYMPNIIKYFLRNHFPRKCFQSKIFSNVGSQSSLSKALMGSRVGPVGSRVGLGHVSGKSRVGSVGSRGGSSQVLAKSRSSLGQVLGESRQGLGQVQSSPKRVSVKSQYGPGPILVRYVDFRMTCSNSKNGLQF